MVNLLVCSVLLQFEAQALAQREAALAANQASQQAELDSLLEKQEERLRSWEAGCAEMENKIEESRKQLAAEEERSVKDALPCSMLVKAVQ